MGLLEARCYIKQLRKPQKIAYAEAYLLELEWGIPILKRPFNDLKYMTKQAIRMELDNLYLNQ